MFQDQNGPLTYYEIQFLQNQFDSVLNTTLRVHAVDLLIQYSALEEHTVYTVIVAAATSTGHGPFSPAVTFTTQEDGQ